MEREVMIRVAVALLFLAPMPLAAHPQHPADEGFSLSLIFHYMFSFDHYAGTISFVVAGAGFILYRNLRRKWIAKKGKTKAEH